MNRKTLSLLACCLATPAVIAAQTGGLTRVQLLALQQELKEQCGLQHSTGVMDGPTRHAIAVCNKKFGTQGNGAALLAAMDVGFGTGDSKPGMGGVMGHRDEGMAMGNDSVAHARSHAARGRAARRARAGARGHGRGDMDSDAAKHQMETRSGGVDVDLQTDDRKAAHDSAMAGMRDGRVRNPGRGKRGKTEKDSTSR